jgi:PPE-repeat protein
VFDFGALAPEINSGRIYTGPGSGPMMAAASAWDGLAAELGTAASGYTSVVEELTSTPWLGPAAQAMLAAVTPYVTWIAAAAGQAEEAASQARAAAGAYETAFMMSVPPPVIAANRVQLTTLVATNFFGQNTAAIAATEAEYMEMWAQDAAAMYGYAGSSALATDLAQFTDPPNTTSPGAAGSQSTAVAQATATPAGNSAQTAASTIPQLLTSVAGPQVAQQAATSTATTDGGLIYNTIYNFLTEGLPTPSNNWLGLVPANYTTLVRLLQGYFAVGLGAFGTSIWQQTFNGLGTTAGAGGAWYPTPQFASLFAGGWATPHTAIHASATASLSSAAKIGQLSVPVSWTNGSSGASATATKALSAGFAGEPNGANGAVNAALRGMPLAGTRGAQRTGNLGVRYGFRYSVLTRPPSAG